MIFLMLCYSSLWNPVFNVVRDNINFISISILLLQAIGSILNLNLKQNFEPYQMFKSWTLCYITFNEILYHLIMLLKLWYENSKIISPKLLSNGFFAFINHRNFSADFQQVIDCLRWCVTFKSLSDNKVIIDIIVWCRITRIEILLNEKDFAKRACMPYHFFLWEK